MRPRVERHIFQAGELGVGQVGHLVTVAHQPDGRARGFLHAARPATPRDEGARPGDVVLELDPCRADATRSVGWSIPAAPETRVLVHSRHLEIQES